MPPFIEHFPYLGLFALLILGGIGMPFPEDATLILCGFLISTGVVKPVPALLVVYSGLLLTDFFLHFVGRKYGQNIVHQGKFRKIISSEGLLKLEEYFHKGEMLFILIGRHIVGLRAQIFIVSGVMKMSPLKFIITDAFSSIFTIVLMVGAGYAGGNSLLTIHKGVARIEHIVMLLLMISMVVYLLFRYFKISKK